LHLITKEFGFDEGTASLNLGKTPYSSNSLSEFHLQNFNFDFRNACRRCLRFIGTF